MKELEDLVSLLQPQPTSSEPELKRKRDKISDNLIDLDQLQQLALPAPPVDLTAEEEEEDAPFKRPKPSIQEEQESPPLQQQPQTPPPPAEEKKKGGRKRGEGATRILNNAYPDAKFGEVKEYNGNWYKKTKLGNNSVWFKKQKQKQLNSEDTPKKTSTKFLDMKVYPANDFLMVFMTPADLSKNSTRTRGGSTSHEWCKDLARDRNHAISPAIHLESDLQVASSTETLKAMRSLKLDRPRQR